MGRPAGPHLQRFLHIGYAVRNVVYVVEYSSGLIKVGFSNRVPCRLRKLSMDCQKRGESLARYELFYGPEHKDRFRLDPDKNEVRAIAALKSIGVQVPGTKETFAGIPFDAAVRAVSAVVITTGA